MDEGIRRVLLRTWDPMLVGDTEALAGEYDTYVWRVYRALERPISEPQLAALLMRYEQELGVQPNLQAAHSAARELLQIVRRELK